MDSTQLERGTLESKDRDELTTIANALGGKPGSRARKAEIVDLILDLTGTGSNWLVAGLDGVRRRAPGRVGGRGDHRGGDCRGGDRRGV